MDSALLQGVIQLLSHVECAKSMVAMGSALSTTAAPPHIAEVGVASMAAREKCARWKAAALLQ